LPADRADVLCLPYPALLQKTSLLFYFANSRYFKIIYTPTEGNEYAVLVATDLNRGMSCMEKLFTIYREK
jgi:hypothetical protein